MKRILYYFCSMLLTLSLHAMDVKKANDITQKLNSQPVKVTQNDAQESNPIKENTLSIIERLVKLYQILQAQAEDKAIRPFSAKHMLHPSDKDDSVLILRDTLKTLGYLPKETPETPFYDMVLEEAVKTFQAAHCIDPDGIIGEKTISRLNWSFDQRINMLQQSINTLQKLLFTNKTIIVNIPTYRLYGFQNNAQAIKMKVIVGKPERPTPFMSSYINAIEFYPIWVVPRTILFKDILPKVQENTDYFEENNMQVFEQNGDDNEEIDPTQVDWSDVHEYNFPYILKQKPGKKNSLGLIRFNLVNNEEIYLHDTPEKKLFQTVFSRALSSGCIRVEKPKKLGAWLLNIDKEKINDDLEDEETKTKQLDENVITHIVYLPVWIEEDGTVLWGDDPYKLQPQPETYPPEMT